MCFGFVERLEHVDIMTGFKDHSNVEDSAETGILDTNMSAVSMALQGSVRRAGQEKRLVKGLLQCAQILDTNAEDVLYCVLPANACDDLTLDLHITLVEAFCRENDIPLIKVANMEKLSKVAMCSGTESMCCLLVQFSDKSSQDDEAVMEFFQDNYDCVPQPVLNV